MSLSASMSNALSGLGAASRMAEVVSSNLANALTDGYARRIVQISSQDIGGRGGGVRVDGVIRIVDRGLLADRRLADAALARDDRMAAAFSRLEQVAGRADSPDSLAGRIVRLEGTLVAASSDPSSAVRLEDVLAALDSVTEGFAAESRAITGMRNDAEAAIAADVEALDRALGGIHRLNEDISRALTGGQDATALMDARQLLIDEVSSIVPVRTLDRPGGKLAVLSTSGAVLVDSRPAEIGFTPANVIVPGMTYAGGQLQGLTFNGDPVSPSNGFARLDGGSLGAAFRLRDEVLPAQQRDLDARAADLIARFEDAAVDPTWSPGATGLLTDGGGPLDTSDITGLAARMGVSAAIDPAAGGALWRLRDGTAASTRARSETARRSTGGARPSPRIARFSPAAWPGAPQATPPTA
ncbi:FlgK family flagellar hook-associated protein [Wenxinia saemankumensis]|uniref:FlgK family flagellar hook-associated protein n=1 Tax=Wenxinia saemankumensis TaxID=1447782 RepID=UPI0009FA6767|nr:flagellar basal body protein [Wenxinia saemankumensis]